MTGTSLGVGAHVAYQIAGLLEVLGAEVADVQQRLTRHPLGADQVLTQLTTNKPDNF